MKEETKSPGTDRPAPAPSPLRLPPHPSRLTIIPVACGVLVDSVGQVLMAQRPAGKIAAGKWEFPGGKIEAGEQAFEALARELDEELGVRPTIARPLIAFRHDYSDRSVLLDTWRVESWSGTPKAREGQLLRWVDPLKLCDLDALPTVHPIIKALSLPADYVFTPPATSLDTWLGRLSAMRPGALLRLRRPGLDDVAYAREAALVAPAAASRGLGLMLDRDPRQLESLPAAGWHASSAALAGLRERPVEEDRWFAASVHTPKDLARALELGADFAVLGPLFPTATHAGASGLGLEVFSSWVRAAGLPVFALGGVGPDRLEDVRKAGAVGTAGISAYWMTPAA